MRNIFFKIQRAAVELAESTPHECGIHYFTKSDVMEVFIHRDGDLSKTPKVLSTLFMKPEAILFELLSLINEKEVAA